MFISFLEKEVIPSPNYSHSWSQKRTTQTAQRMTMNQTGGPQWANPETTRSDAVMQEEEFFAPLSTLDEPVMETIMRDVRAVGSKLKVVMLPMERNVSFALMSAQVSPIIEIS